VGCASFQRRLIYFPPVYGNEQAAHLARTANLEPWTAANGTANGWKRPFPAGPSTAQVVFIHGNACSAIQCADYANDFQKAGSFDVFFLEFPGYGERPGKPSMNSIQTAGDDALLSLDTNKPIYLVGQSLGNGAACYLAGHFPDRVKGLILLAPYNSLTAVAQWHMPILPVYLLMADRYPAQQYLTNYHGPVAILIGGKDVTVPAKFGRKLYNKYDGPKRLWEFPNADHGSVMEQPPKIWSEIFAFVQGR